jgi:formate dehydrogenase iron-sulfur subunit
LGLGDPTASFEEYLAAGGTRGLERALSMAPEAVIDEVDASGLRGLGGAASLTPLPLSASGVLGHL